MKHFNTYEEAIAEYYALRREGEDPRIERGFLGDATIYCAAYSRK